MRLSLVILTSHLILISSYGQAATATDTIEDFLKVDEQVQSLNCNINKPKKCDALGADKKIAPMVMKTQEKWAPLSTPLTEIDGTGGDAKLRVSSVSPEKAKELFQYIRGKKDLLQLDDPADGCMGRAQIISYRLEKQFGVQTGKAWMRSGSFGGFEVKLPGQTSRYTPSWTTHVAPFVEVKTAAGNTETWVLDPILDDKNPLPLKEWQNRLTSHPGANQLDLTSRFVYQDSEINQSPTKYSVDDLDAHNYLLRALAKAQRGKK